MRREVGVASAYRTAERGTVVCGRRTGFAWAYRTAKRGAVGVVGRWGHEGVSDGEAWGGRVWKEDRVCLGVSDCEAWGG